jgi:opacity protein-like surface antigen
LRELQTQWQQAEDDRGSAWGLFAGYRIMRYAAVELAYQNLGKLQESGNAAVILPTKIPLGTLYFGEFKRELETSGPSLSALGILPITDAWSVYARAGVLFADMKLASSIAGYNASTSSNSQSLLWGAGTQFDFGAHWSVRADFQRFNDVGETGDTGRADIDLLSLGVIFRL